MLVISFYTADGNYPALASRLRDSCDQFNLRHKIVQLPTRETWRRTINIKADFILKSLLAEKGPVLWLDCDCEIRQRPTAFDDAQFDFAILNWLIACRDYDGSTILNSGGVSYWNYTPEVIDLLTRWNRACQENPTEIDDQTLDAVWKRQPPNLRAAWLPREYNWMEPQFGPVPENCVIWHDYANGRHREANATRLQTA